MAALTIPPGDFWFAGFDLVVENAEVWRAILAEFPDEDVEPCPGDLALLAKVAATREAQRFTKAKRELMARRPGPVCSRALDHPGRHVACGAEPRVIAAWPGTHEVAIADLTQVLDEPRQAP